MDLAEARAWLPKFKRRHKAPLLEISSLEAKGLEELKAELLKRVGKF